MSAGRRIPIWVRALVTVTVLAAAVWFLMIPQFSDAEASFAAIEQVSTTLVVASFLLQALSLGSY